MLIAASESTLQRAVVVSLLQTGIRPSELERVDASSFVSHSSLLQIPKSSHAGERTVVLPSAARSSLEALFADQEAFPSRRHIERIVKTVGNRAALDRVVSPLVLRHTYESILRQDAFPPALVSHLLVASVDSSDESVINQIKNFVDQFFRPLIL